MDDIINVNTTNTWELNYCNWCGSRVDKDKVYGGRYCSVECMEERDDYRVKITNNPKLKGNTIMCGCPMTTEKNWVIPDYLSSIAAQEYPKKDLHLAFLINHPVGQDDEGGVLGMILDSFITQFGDEYKKIDVWEAETNFEESKRVHGRNFNSFANIRNVWLKMRDTALDGDRYIFSVDSDILMPPYELKRLMHWVKDKGYDAVAGLLSNGPTAENQEAYNFMSILENEIHLRGDKIYIHRAPGMLEVHADWSSTPNDEGYWKLVGLEEVPMTGANILYKREILDSGVDFGFHFQGEDCYFAEKARDRGFKMFVDFAVVPHHVMNPAVLQQLKQPPIGFVVKPPVMDEHLIPKTMDEQVVTVVDKW